MLTSLVVEAAQAAETAEPGASNSSMLLMIVFIALGFGAYKFSTRNH